MSRYNKTRVAPTALVIIIVVVAVAALVSLTRAIFFSGQTNISQVDVSQSALLSTATDRAVQMEVRGPIVGNEEFHSYVLIVTPSSRSLTTYTGYADKEINQQVMLSNNTPAYEQFVYALNRANLARGTQLSGEKNDTRGICATGQLTQFSIVKANTSVKTLWTSTCRGSAGSLSGSVKDLTSLFTSQIPDARSITSKVKL